MKIYVIMQKATEYNDEYDAVQEEGAKVYKAFRNKPTQEQIDAAAWDAIRGKTPEYSGWPDNMAYVEELEVDSNQILPSQSISLPVQTGAQEQILLHYKLGTSDKLYRISLSAAQRGTGYVVDFAYGRRGQDLKTGTKTEEPVSREEAKKIYDRLVAEKITKGYKPI